MNTSKTFLSIIIGILTLIYSDTLNAQGNPVFEIRATQLVPHYINSVNVRTQITDFSTKQDITFPLALDTLRNRDSIIVSRTLSGATMNAKLFVDPLHTDGRTLISKIFGSFRSTSGGSPVVVPASNIGSIGCLYTIRNKTAQARRLHWLLKAATRRDSLTNTNVFHTQFGLGISPQAPYGTDASVSSQDPFNAAGFAKIEMTKRDSSAYLIPANTAITFMVFTHYDIAAGGSSAVAAQANVFGDMFVAFSDTVIADSVQTPPVPTPSSAEIIQFKLDSLIYTPADGPEMLPLSNVFAYTAYHWADSVTRGRGQTTTLANITPTDLTFRLYQGSLLSFGLVQHANGRNGDERVYGVDTGYIAVQNVPKLRFKQIMWHTKSFYPTNILNDSTYVEGIAVIDTMRSDPQFRALIGNQIRTLHFDGTSSSMIVQNNVGIYSAVIRVWKDENEYNFITSPQADSVVFPLPLMPATSLFSQSVPNRGNLFWGKNIVSGTLMHSIRDTMRFPAGDTTLRMAYPIELYFGGTMSSYNAKLKLNVQKLLMMGNDSVKNIRVYQQTAADPVLRKVSSARLSFVNPSTLIIDSVRQNGISVFRFFSSNSPVDNTVPLTLSPNQLYFNNVSFGNYKIDSFFVMSTVPISGNVQITPGYAALFKVKLPGTSVWQTMLTLTPVQGAVQQKVMIQYMPQQNTPSQFTAQVIARANNIDVPLMLNVMSGGFQPVPSARFKLDTLIFFNPNGPVTLGGELAYLEYRWDSVKTKLHCLQSNISGVAANTLSIKYFKGSLALFKQLRIPLNGVMRTGDERGYGLDSGYMAVNGVPKIIFSKILWHVKSFYAVASPALPDTHIVEGIAVIDTMASDRALLASILPGALSVRFQAGSSSLKVQGTEGFYSSSLDLYFERKALKMIRAQQTDTMDFAGAGIPMKAVFSQATANGGNNDWGKRTFVLLQTDNSGLQNDMGKAGFDTTLTLKYPIDLLFGTTLATFKAKLTFNLQNTLNAVNDTLSYVRVFQDTPGDTNRRISPTRIANNPPYVMTVDSVTQTGSVGFLFYSTNRKYLRPTGVAERNNSIIPNGFVMEQNYPNPFNPTTVIRYGIPEQSRVKISVYSILGQHVATLVNGIEPAGFHERTFDASHLSTGLYIYRIEAVTVQNGSKIFSVTKKMLLVK